MPAHYSTRLRRSGYLFILPCLVLLSVFIFYPLLSAMWMSLHEWNLLQPKRFVGLRNFVSMVGDSRLVNSVWRTVHFTLVASLSVLFVAFVLALVFTSRSCGRLKYKNTIQSLIFVPVVLSVVAIGVVWKFMFQSSGLLSVVTTRVLGVQVRWLTSTALAPYSIALVFVWRLTGYYMVMFIAGLLEIPEMYYESAQIDGAGFLQRLLRITLPLLRNVVTLVVVTCVISTFGSFALQFVIVEGGPSRSNELIALLIYAEAFVYSKFGYSSALSVSFFVALLLFTLLQLRLLRSGSLYD